MVQWIGLVADKDFWGHGPDVHEQHDLYVNRQLSVLCAEEDGWAETIDR